MGLKGFWAFIPKLKKLFINMAVYDLLTVFDGTTPRVHISSSTAPANPAAGSLVIYTDGTDLFTKNNAGVSVNLTNYV